ncbi:acyl-CoA dehydrogenase family protein [Streptomyces yaizuensis]|uniref:Acyl-CoA dehydrogenase family protein n=1 Tax=Streptomyces yaizuensis TaxID=2989713 RepID=A0ABQ5NSZ0_9ACTN|nr:acyl-CoA dehydrogenase family protein [Streptomyces sp. YSPA8]GLF93263.1 acyl-CoA dehydrogenase family protein [Streptomyces sp. YSPA8]
MTVDRAVQQTPSPEELLSRARDLIPVFRSHAERTESERDVVAPNMRALRESGLLRLTLPERFGGHPVDVRGQVEVLSEIGRGCASTGWIAANHAASTDFALLLPEEGLREVFGENPDAVLLSAASPHGCRAQRVADGLVINGRFPYASGCRVSDWALLAAVPLIEDGAEVGAVDALVRPEEMEIEDTWHMAGLAGTGTHAMTAVDLFVPERRALVPARREDGRYDELLSPTVLVKGNLHSLSALVGAARGVWDEVRRALDKGRQIAYSTYDNAADSPAVRLWFAEATHLLETATLHLRAAADGLDRAGGQELERAERARLRMHSASALECSRRGTQRLLDIAGTSAFAKSNPIQRYWRDLETGSRHAMLNHPVIVEDYSRSLFGLDGVSPWH